ncbi:MAG: nicotinamide mononucleotide transporter [Clostridia bacterium]|nr:nicotinamide mononucleotide transporter [Clostridia bacterium]
MQKIRNPFKQLNRFEWTLWAVSAIIVIAAFLIPEKKDIPSLVASLIGVTALIFVAKGMVLGQALTVVFAVGYGIVSWSQKYYGEMITYLCMSAPMAISAIVSWVKHPYKDSAEVQVSKLSKKAWLFLSLASLLVTVAFYFILKALGTANLPVSTLSVTTSFFAASLTFLRSPYYALGYTANDVVLIVLWVFSAVADLSYLPMVLCFVMFLLNDLYGFFNWKRMEKRQAKDE